MVQLEQISKFLLECPEAALNVHKYLQKHYGDQQQQLFTPVNPTFKRDRPLDDSRRSISNESRTAFWKQRFEFDSIRLYFEERGSGSVQFDHILKNAVRVRFSSTAF